MIFCYDCLYNENKKLLYVYLFLKRVEQCGDKVMQFVVLFNMGKMLYYQGNKEKGYEYLEQVIEMMLKMDYWYKYDNLCYDYNILLIFQKLDRCNEEVFRILVVLEKVVIEEIGSEILMEGLSVKEKKVMYVYYVVVFFWLGQVEEVECYYWKFLVESEEYDCDDYLIMFYLFDRKMYD